MTRKYSRLHSPPAGPQAQGWTGKYESGHHQCLPRGGARVRANGETTSTGGRAQSHRPAGLDAKPGERGGHRGGAIAFRLIE